MGSMYARRKIRGIEVPPEVLSAFVLERLKQDAQRRLGPIPQAVITVPAFFDETRRKATQDAGRLVGLEVLDIINEPTAAALAYGHLHGRFLGGSSDGDAKPMRVLVYDLGGGTFDVTILELAGTQFRTLATDGDVLLGGKGFRRTAGQLFAEQFLAAQGVDPRSDPQDAAQLWLDAQDAKHTLSERSKATVVCIHAGIRMRIEVTREQFEDLTRDLLERTETTTSLVIKQAGLTWRQIDRVLLVGGSGRMPMIGQMLRKVTGKEPDCSLSPDEVVAHGAAIYAAMLVGDATLRRRRVQAGERQFPQPGRRRNARADATEDQRDLDPEEHAVAVPRRSDLLDGRSRPASIQVVVVEGESHRPEACIALGECVVRDLPPGLPKNTAVEVEYAYRADGRISVSARVPSIRYSQHVEIQRNAGRNLSDLDAWRSRLCGHSDTSTWRINRLGLARWVPLPSLELCGVYDFWYEIDDPMELNDERTDTVFVLRKRGLPS